MSEGQAGVSAEAVAKLVAKWRDVSSQLSKSATDAAVVDAHMTFAAGASGSGAYMTCADELEAALATAPPQAASAGVLPFVEAGYFVAHETSYTQYPSGAWGWVCACGESDQFGDREGCMERTRDHWAKCLNALLAAHDQKVRAEVLLDASRLISGSCKDDGSETDEALTWAASRIRLLAETGK